MEFFNVKSAKGRSLDLHLSKAHFRLGTDIFTTDFLFKDLAVPVYWLRYDVKRVQLSSRAKGLIRKNDKFEVISRPFTLTNELEGLYYDYWISLDFDPHGLNTYIDGMNIFDTNLIEIRDAGKLVAAGFFDKGNSSIAGTMNIYHPEYKKYSLGIYLILMKHRYCLENNIQWFYPGYICPDYPKFNYKLDLDRSATEVFDSSAKKWVPYLDFSKSVSHLVS